VSLLSTLLIFQGGMVWTVTEGPDNSLGDAIEKMSIVLVSATCTMAMAVEVKVYRERLLMHDEDREAAEKEFDSEEANPVHEPDGDAKALAEAHQSSQRVLTVEGLDFGD
jgi:hypothetical protein